MNKELCIKVGKWNNSILWCTVEKTSNVLILNFLSIFSSLLKVQWVTHQLLAERHLGFRVTQVYGYSFVLSLFICLQKLGRAIRFWEQLSRDASFPKTVFLSLIIIQPTNALIVCHLFLNHFLKHFHCSYMFR